MRQALDDEFAVAEAMIRARALAGLSQTRVAEGMGMTRPAIAKISVAMSI